MKKSAVKKLVITFLLLALCVIAQQLRMLSQFVTGPIINAAMIASVLLAGLYSGLAVSVFTPVIAIMITPMTIMRSLPQLFPVVIIGNCVLVLFVYFLREKSLILSLIAGSAAKTLLLWPGVSFVILPLFGGGLTPEQKTALTAAFSYNQLLTALAGSLLILLLLPIIDILLAER